MEDHNTKMIHFSIYLNYDKSNLKITEVHSNPEVPDRWWDLPIWISYSSPMRPFLGVSCNP